MGLRSRLGRENRRRQQERARKKRREGLMKVRPCCPGCDTALVRDDEAGLDIWGCAACGKTFLRAGPRWLTELDTAASAEHGVGIARQASSGGRGEVADLMEPDMTFAVVEFRREAA